MQHTLSSIAKEEKKSESLIKLCQDEDMKSTDREKMCISCEGRIPFDAEICSYCASKQSGGGIQNSFQTPIFQNQSLEDSLTSLYTPPYQGKRPQFAQSTTSQPDPTEEDEHPMYKEVTERPEMNPLLGATVDEEEAPPRSSLIPTTLLFAGANFSLLGLMQLFFSKNGILRLEWDANYWFFYCLFGIPLLYFGLKKIKHLDRS